MEFADTEGSDGESIRHAVGVVGVFVHEARLDEVDIAPGETADQGKLTAGHGLGFSLGDVEALGEAVEQLGAGEGLAVGEGLKEGEQKLVLGRDRHGIAPGE